MAVVNERAVISAFGMLDRPIIRLPKVLGSGSQPDKGPLMWSLVGTALMWNPVDTTLMWSQ